MNKTGIALSLLFFIPVLVMSETENSLDADIQLHLNKWINNDISHDTFLSHLNDIDHELDREPVEWKRDYGRSRLFFLKGQIYYEKGNKKQSIKELERCLEWAEKSIEKQETSAAWSTMSEATSLLMIQKGFLFIVANHSLAREQAERALEIDPDNRKASFVMAQFLCNAPPVGGGNKEEGEALFLSLSQQTDLSDSDRFYTLQSLSEFYFSENRISEAGAYSLRALEIFPGNVKNREFLNRLKADS